MVEIAVVCPLGYLSKHGYQHVYMPCLSSIAAFADALYLVQSIDERAGLDELIMAYDNIVLIGDERTWFDVRDGVPRFDLPRIRDNVNLGIDQARKDGLHVAMCIEVNQYVPTEARRALRHEAEQMRTYDYPYGWLYRRDQLADVTFSANLRRPWIWNLAHDVRLEIPDGASYDGQFIRHSRGNWPAANQAAVVDCANEMSFADWQEKLEFFRFYQEFVPKRPTTFDLNYWMDYTMNKFRQKEVDGGALDLYGQAIAAVSMRHDEFMSHAILNRLVGEFVNDAA